MRTLRAAALTVLAVVVSTVLAAAPATAGGPTSVLLVAPGTGATTSLYVADSDYHELARLVGSDGAPTGEAVEDASSYQSGRSVTITWLIHDVVVWRVDRLFLDAKGGPLLSTQLAIGENVSMADAPTTMHRPAEPKALIALLTRLGVGDLPADKGAPADYAAQDSSSAATGSESADEGASTTAATPGSAGSTVPAVGWVLAGLVAGAVLTLTGVRLTAARRRPTDDAAAEPALDPEWVLTDRLASTAPPRR